MESRGLMWFLIVMSIAMASQSIVRTRAETERCVACLTTKGADCVKICGK